MDDRKGTPTPITDPELFSWAVRGGDGHRDEDGVTTELPDAVSAIHHQVSGVPGRRGSVHRVELDPDRHVTYRYLEEVSQAVGGTHGVWFPIIPARGEGQGPRGLR